jgi:hypothetical protein
MPKSLTDLKNPSELKLLSLIKLGASLDTIADSALFTIRQTAICNLNSRREINLLNGEHFFAYPRITGNINSSEIEKIYNSITHDGERSAESVISEYSEGIERLTILTSQLQKKLKN